MNAPLQLNVPKIRAARSERCELCKYADEIQGGAGMYQCRFNPPQVFLVPGPQGQPAPISACPPVKAGDFCHEFTLNLLKGN